MSYVDLHIHSESSDDGEYSAEELLGLCQELKMKRVAICDHNSVKSVARAISRGKELGIEVISGIEIDCTYAGHNFHLLGYNFDISKEIFEEHENNILRQEQEAAVLKIAKIREALQVELDEEEVLAKAQNGIVTGELLAEILLDKDGAAKNPLLVPYISGDRSDMPYVNFYWDYFSQGKPAYVPIHYPSLKEAIDMIHQAGGVSVLAHPAQNLKGEFELIEELIKEGIEGIEVFSSYHDEAAVRFFLDKAREHNLLITCGSDFHGKTKPTIKIGDCNLTVDEGEILKYAF